MIFSKIEKKQGNVSVVVTEETNIYVEMMKEGVQVTFFCLNYIYTGIIEAVNGETIVLKGARLVYETGAFTDVNFKDAQSFGSAQWFVRIPAIESFGVLNKN